MSVGLSENPGCTHSHGQVWRCAGPHLQPDHLLDVDRLGGLEVHLQAVLCLAGDGPLHGGHGEVIAQVIQAGDPPGYRQGCDVAEKNHLAFFPAETKRSFVYLKWF